MTIIYAIFFVSGSSALIFETLWFRQAGLGFGNSVWASSLVLSGFMGGLAIGNAWAARQGDRLLNPIRIYAIAEVAIAITGVGLVYVFPILGAATAPLFRPLLEQPWILNPVRLLFAFTLLLIPSTAMGLTLPLLTKVLIAEDPNFGSVLGRLYGWNTVGGVIGVVIGEVLLIRVLGVHGTALFAGTLNLMAAVIAGWLSRKTRPSSPSSFNTKRFVQGQEAGKDWLVSAFLSGFCLLALEVIWFRFLLLFVVGQSVAFAIMLAVVLAGIAVGGLAASLWLRFRPDAYRFISSMAFTAGLLCIVSYAAFPWAIRPYGIRQIYDASDILHVGIPLMFPVCFMSGILFTLLGAALRNNRSSESETTGVLTLANTLGAVLGSLAGGFLLLPVAGMERSLFLIAVIYGGMGLWLTLRNPAVRRSAYAAGAVFVLAVILFPFGAMGKNYLPIPVQRYFRNDEGRVAAVREGLTETVIYFETLLSGKPMTYRMLTNSYSMAGTDYKSARYMKLFVYWPMAVHPDVRRALLICYGVGNTAKAMTDSKSIETIDVVDISRDVLEMNRIVYSNEADYPLQDPRVHVHIEDGRYYLQTTEQRFDLITAEPPPPGIAGVENLYTREYFQLIYNRLAEGGIVTYWLPLRDLTDVSTKAVLRAFCDVFNDCSLWNGTGRNLMMVGTRNARGPVSEEQFDRQWNDPGVETEMKAVGIERPEQLGALFIGDADYLNRITAGARPLVDNYPKQIEAPFESMEAANRLLASFTDVTAARERFQNSPMIKRLWPPRLLTASLPFFEVQDIINAFLYGKRMNPRLAIEDAHDLLTRTSLSTPVLWRLGSDSDIQRILADAPPAELAPAVMQFHLGIRLISERHYAAAVEPLARAEQPSDLHEDAFRLRVYALCMSGQIDHAQWLAHARLSQLQGSAKGLAEKSPGELSLPPFWLWMKKTFGIDPRESRGIPEGKRAETLNPTR